MPKFRKKPIVIEAIQWDGDPRGTSLHRILEMSSGTIRFNDDTLFIETEEGTMTASLNDWIIKGVQGECYPCKPDIFEATYEPV